MTALVSSLGQQSTVSAARYSHIRHEGCYYLPCVPVQPGAEKRDEMLYIIVECATYLSNVPASMFVIGDVLGCATGGLFADR